jgi:hypothetical protein
MIYHILRVPWQASLATTASRTSCDESGKHEKGNGPRTSMQSQISLEEYPLFQRHPMPSFPTMCENSMRYRLWSRTTFRWTACAPFPLTPPTKCRIIMLKRSSNRSRFPTSSLPSSTVSFHPISQTYPKLHPMSLSRGSTCILQKELGDKSNCLMSHAVRGNASWLVENRDLTYLCDDSHLNLPTA